MSKQTMVTIDPVKLRAFVSLALYEDSKMLKFAKAKIKNGEKASQLDVVQAISYAAHMLYKFMEQDAIE